MGIKFRTEYLKRYKDMAHLLIKYGQSDLVYKMGMDSLLENKDNFDETDRSKAEELPKDLEKLGPTYIKLGQFFSTRSDLLPSAYLDALSRLQDEVEPVPFEVVEKTFASELGVRISKAFNSFDENPIAAASLGQVHKAELRNGKIVAVKIQRPDIRNQIFTDLEAFEDVAEFLDEHTEAGEKLKFGLIIEEFRKALIRELDYKTEARNLTTIKQNLKTYPNIAVPLPVDDYTTSKILTMEFIIGKKITQITPLGKMEFDGKELADELFKAYLQQILVDGFYHADPHPGNIFITEDHKLALLDLGMVAHVSDKVQKKLLQFLFDVSEGNGEDAAKHILEMSEKSHDFDEKEFYSKITDLVIKYQNLSVSQIEVGRIVLEITQISTETGIIFPREMTLLGKSLLNLDKVGRSLDPEFNPNESIHRHSSELLSEKMRQDVSAKGFFNTLLDTKEFFTMLPERINTILGNLASNELSLNVKAIDEQYLMTGIQKIANRVTAGLILAALIIGAALMMNVETEFKVFGYPAIAIVFFLVAALGGLAIVYQIIFGDEKKEKEHK